MKRTLNIIVNLVLILCSIMAFNSCEELEEALDEINNEIGAENTCYTSWTGKWNGISDITSHLNGENCSISVNVSITYDSESNKVVVRTSDYAHFVCDGEESVYGEGNCGNNRIIASFNGSNKHEIVLNRTGNEINGTSKYWIKDGSGNLTLHTSQRFNLTKD
ncbi:hypothetical protein EYD45_01900 [Hyunsoonleella flava]|uniref:Lipocalin-like domain-containing protein n=1 Tax=Hyunsoonleella flava TaxID=2527939 RepID=A0A4Q9FI49_9FLAO|nr:hypothetical protein [Hyunsoonleella flava]TBN06661.1 hypothetical protein EYD45_01900 [Hyunsoonleella flava]